MQAERGSLAGGPILDRENPFDGHGSVGYHHGLGEKYNSNKKTYRLLFTVLYMIESNKMRGGRGGDREKVK